MFFAPTVKVLASCIAKEIGGLFKRSLSERGTCAPFKPAEGWFVNYAINYFQSNTKYSELFSSSHSPNGVLNWRAFLSEKISNEVGFKKLPQVLHSLAKSKSKISRTQFLKFDQDSVKLLETRLDPSSSILLLSLWHALVGQAVFETAFYKSLLQVWTCTAHTCRVPELVVMVFFLGQSKHTPKILIASIRERLEELQSEPTFDEWTIICHNFFVMKVKLPRTILHQVLELTCKLLPNVERFQLIAILKSIRHSHYPIDALLLPLSDYILQTYREYNFVECTNFLATYANADSYDGNVFEKLESHIFTKPLPELLPKLFIPHLHQLHPSIRIRSKDVARLLWAFAHTGHEPAPQSLEQLIEIIRRKISEGDFQNNPHHLVDCLKSLTLYGVYPYDLLNHTLNKTFIDLCRNMGRAKPSHQLFFVGCSIEIECQTYKGNRISKELLQQLSTYPRKNPTKQLSIRNGSSALLSLLNDHYERNGCVKYASLLPHIPIEGAIIYMDKEMQFPVEFPLTDKELTDLRCIVSGALDFTRLVSFEVADATVTVCGRPSGLLATKIRQLKILGCKVVLLSPDDILELSRHADVKEKIKKLI